MPIHTIQLRGPWQLKPLARTRFVPSDPAQSKTLGPNELDVPSLPPEGRLNPVGDWSPLLGDFRGIVRYERPFHRPTGLSGEPVSLVIEGVDWRAAAYLNQEFVGELVWGETLRVDVRERLETRNLLWLDIELPEPDEAGATPFREGRSAEEAGGLIGGVRLEIG